MRQIVRTLRHHALLAWALLFGAMVMAMPVIIESQALAQAPMAQQGGDATATPSPAAAADVTAPRQPGLKKGTPFWCGYAVMFLLLVVVVAISVMPSKRSHQD